LRTGNCRPVLRSVIGSGRQPSSAPASSALTLGDHQCFLCGHDPGSGKKNKATNKPRRISIPAFQPTATTPVRLHSAATNSIPSPLQPGDPLEHRPTADNENNRPPNYVQRQRRLQRRQNWDALNQLPWFLGRGGSRRPPNSGFAPRARLNLHGRQPLTCSI